MLAGERQTRFFLFFLSSSLLIINVQSAAIDDGISNTAARASDNPLDELTKERSTLVSELGELLTELDGVVEAYEGKFDGKEDDISNLLTKLNTKWKAIQLKSKEILRLKTAQGLEDRKQELEYQDELTKDYSAVLFRAKKRRCESPKETFYEPESKCYPIKATKGGPCPEKQLLYDLESSNIGACDCDEEISGMTFYNATNTCYLLNSQGPCVNSNEWLVLMDEKSHFPVCQPVPHPNCLTDGTEVLYQGSCKKLRSKEPCQDGKVLLRDPSDPYKIGCFTDTADSGFASTDKVETFPCPKGQSRAQNGQCALNP